MPGIIVHEWVERAGGAEKVVDQFVALHPEADLLTLWDDSDGRYGPTVMETWAARTPFRRHKALAVPILPLVWRTLGIKNDFEWSLVSSHLFAHHARLPGHAAENKFVYAHTPARYIWDPDLDTRGRGLAARMASTVLRPIDRKRAREAKKIAANSNFTRDRIMRAWDRDADVIYPPVDTDRIRSVADWSSLLTSRERDLLESVPPEFILGASRWVQYKRLDVVIDAGSACGLPVVIAGSGPDAARLAAKASSASVPVQLIERPSDALLYSLYQRSLAYVFPAVEDFGIMPVEALACGTPIVVPDVGGAAETVKITNGGSTFSNLDRHSLREAVERSQTVDRALLPARAAMFSNSSFRQSIANWMGLA